MRYNPYDPIANILAGLDQRLRAAEANAGVVVPLEPVFTVPASISSDGTPQVGETLIGIDGIVSYANSYSRRWLLGSTLLTTSAAFTPLVEGSYRFEVDATGPGGTTTSGSNITVAASGTVTPTPTPTPTPSAVTIDSIVQRSGNNLIFTARRSENIANAEERSYALAGSSDYLPAALASDFGGVFPTAPISFLAGAATAAFTVSAPAAVQPE
jgi:hypothetical protein